MARLNPAADLAARCVVRLAELREAGVDYPPRLDRLLALTAGDQPADVQAKALKQAAFKQKTIRGHARDPAAPVALAEDADRLATSEALFAFVCQQSTTGGPPWNATELKKFVPKPLQPGFERGLRERIAAGDRSIALTNDEWLRMRLLAALANAAGASSTGASSTGASSTGASSTGASSIGASRPCTVRGLAERAGCDPLRNATKLKKIVGTPAFLQEAVTLLDKTLDTTVAPIDDAHLLAARPESLATLVAAARTDSKRLLAVRDVLKKASAGIRPFLQAHIHNQLAAGGSLGEIGAIRDGKEYKLFQLQDVEPAAVRERMTRGSLAAAAASRTSEGGAVRAADSPRVESVVPQAPTLEAAGPIGARGHFATEFQAAFQRLDAASGHRNQVGLAPLRSALSAWSRDEFDAELQQLRLAGHYALSGLQSRGGITPEEQAAGIREAGLLRIYVSQRR